MKVLKYTVFYNQLGRTWSETFEVTARDANSGLTKAVRLSVKGLPQYTTVVRVDSHITNTYLGEVA